MITKLWRGLVAVMMAWVLVAPVVAQDADPADVPALTEIFEGSGRLDDLTFAYPAGWFTLEGIPVNRLVSFNIVSSVEIGLRSQVEAGQEAIVFAIAGGRVDRWPSIEADFTPQEILDAFFAQLGDGGGGFGGNERDADAEDRVPVVEEITVAGAYDAVIVRFEATAGDAEGNAAVAEDDAEAFNGEFIAYSIRLDDNRFVVVLVLTSEYTYAEAQPTIDAILNTLDYSP